MSLPLGIQRWERHGLYFQGAQSLGERNTWIIIINPMLEMCYKGFGGHRGGSD